MRKRVFGRLFACILTAGLLLTGRGGNDAGKEQGGDGSGEEQNKSTEAAVLDTVTIPMLGEISSFYTISTGDLLGDILCANFDTLWTVKDAETVDYYVAKGCDVSEDGLEYTVTLNEGIKWHDGEELTADDLVFTIAEADFMGYLPYFAAGPINAEKVLPKNICPLIKSTFGYAYSQKCPYTYFSDLIIGETTCDGKKKMYELLNDIKETYVMHLPQGKNRPYIGDMWYEEVKLLKEKIEEKFQVEITDEKLREAAKFRNDFRKAIVDLYELQIPQPPALLGTELMMSVLAGSFTFDQKAYLKMMQEQIAKARREYEENGSKVNPGRKRILITGSG